MTGQAPPGSGIVRRRRSRSHRPTSAATSRGVTRSASRSPRSPVASSRTPLDRLELRGGQGLAHPAPEHGAQLVLHVEGDAVVDAVAVTVGHGQHVPALAVGVVDEDVEDGHPAHRRAVLVHQRHPAVVLVDAVEDVQPPGRDPSLPHQVDGRLRIVRLLPPLHHARARAARRAGRCGARRSSPAPPTRRTTPPRAPPACRRGSPTAAAPPPPACRPRARRRPRPRRSRSTPASRDRAGSARR